MKYDVFNIQDIINKINENSSSNEDNINISKRKKIITMSQDELIYKIKSLKSTDDDHYIFKLAKKYLVSLGETQIKLSEKIKLFNPFLRKAINYAILLESLDRDLNTYKYNQTDKKEIRDLKNTYLDSINSLLEIHIKWKNLNPNEKNQHLDEVKNILREMLNEKSQVTDFPKKIRQLVQEEKDLIIKIDNESSIWTLENPKGTKKDDHTPIELAGDHNINKEKLGRTKTFTYNVVLNKDGKKEWNKQPRLKTLENQENKNKYKKQLDEIQKQLIILRKKPIYTAFYNKNGKPAKVNFDENGEATNKDNENVNNIYLHTYDLPRYMEYFNYLKT